jgi:hypothetical protein
MGQRHSALKEQARSLGRPAGQRWHAIGPRCDNANLASATLPDSATASMTLSGGSFCLEQTVKPIHRSVESFLSHF